MYIAASKGHVNIVKKLIASGASITCGADNRATPLHEAVWHSHLSTVQAILAHGDGQSCLSVRGYGEPGLTPLECAVKQGHTQIANYIKTLTNAPRNVTGTHKVFIS